MKLWIVFLIFLLKHSSDAKAHRNTKSAGLTKLLVAGGNDIFTFRSSVEVINLDESNPDLTCQNLPDFPVPLFAMTGQLFNKTTPIICGGYDEDIIAQSKCYALESGQWLEIESLPEARGVPSSAVLSSNSDNDLLLVIGGEYFNPYQSFISSIVAYDGTTWKKDFIADLPVPMSNVCIVQVNSSTLFAIGGVDAPFQSTDKTYFYNVIENKWENGPLLNNPRSGHSCGIISWDDPLTGDEIRFVVVTAGEKRDEGVIPSTVEMLDLNNIEYGWQYDKELSHTIYGYSSMVEYEDSVIVIGGLTGADLMGEDRLYRHYFPFGNWIEMKQTLKERRGGHVSFLIPDHLVTCL